MYFPLSHGSLVTLDSEKDMELVVVPLAPVIELGLTTLGSKVSVLSASAPPHHRVRLCERSRTVWLPGGGRLGSSKLFRLCWIVLAPGVRRMLAASN